jgi:hypothetical protein
VTLLLVQTPPEEASDKVEVTPGQITVVPIIAPGSGFTVKEAVEIQVVPREYVIITDPAMRPVTTPVPKPIDAIEGSLEYQPPPPTSESVDVNPAQTCVVPEIGAGGGLTVITEVIEQPVGNV